MHEASASRFGGLDESRASRNGEEEHLGRCGRRSHFGFLFHIRDDRGNGMLLPARMRVSDRASGVRRGWEDQQ
jgi:hypothetical protein